MNINAWGKLAAFGCAAAVIALACNSSTTNNNGTAGAAGAATGGTGGTAGTGGGGTGGTGGGSGGTGGMPADAGACPACLTTTCSSEWTACAADSTCQTEFSCIQNCVLGPSGTGSGKSVSTCAGGSCIADGGSIAATTNNLIACIDNAEAGGCNAECFGGAQP